MSENFEALRSEVSSFLKILIEAMMTGNIGKTEVISARRQAIDYVERLIAAGLKPEDNEALIAAADRTVAALDALIRAWSLN